MKHLIFKLLNAIIVSAILITAFVVTSIALVVWLIATLFAVVFYLPCLPKFKNRLQIIKEGYKKAIRQVINVLKS